MGRMARQRNARPRALGARGAVAGLVAGALALVLLVSCTSDGSNPPPPAESPQNAALKVSTISADQLDEKTRNRVESEVSDVIADYVVGGFLGDYPRTDFVRGLADFSSDLARPAGADLDVLTASRYAKATSVRATRLDVRLSFLLPDGQDVGASAYVDFAFEVTQSDGTKVPITLTGRFSLGVRDGEWQFITYQVQRTDDEGLPSETTSEATPESSS
jgi:hypothetical protein